MDLIYTEPYSKLLGIRELGYLSNSKIDIELGTVLSQARNDFEIITGLSDVHIQKGSLIYDEQGSEIGGIVTGIKVSTGHNELTIKCKLWRGMLTDHVIRPAQSDDYYVFGGDANVVLSNMINNSYDGLIVASDKVSNIMISGKVRYSNILKAYEEALSKANARLKISFDGNKAICEAVSINDLSNSICLDNDYGIPIIAEDVDDGYNHIIALGQGNLKNRQVIELWRMEDGTITESPAKKPSGVSLRTYIYDYSSVESLEELRKEAIKKMKELAPTQTLEIEPGKLDVEIGDIVSAAERITGISMKTQITRKVITGNIINGVSLMTTRYKVGG